MWGRQQAPSFVGSSDRSALQLAASTGSLGLLFFFWNTLLFLGQGPSACFCALRAGDLDLLRRLYCSIPRMFGVRILYVHMSGVLRHIVK